MSPALESNVKKQREKNMKIGKEEFQPLTKKKIDDFCSKAMVGWIKCFCEPLEVQDNSDKRLQAIRFQLSLELNSIYRNIIIHIQMS